jgi:hypothetical protein
MATQERRYGPAGGLTLGGILVIVGVILMIVWNFWLGLIVALVGSWPSAVSRGASGTSAQAGRTLACRPSSSSATPSSTSLLT